MGHGGYGAVHKVVRMQRVRTLAFFVLALVVVVSIGLLVLDAKPAQAAEFRVNWMEEDKGDDALGDGECSIEPHPIGTSPTCTLRAAIEEANANDARDTITFSSGGTIILTLGELEIANDVTGPDLSIEGPEGSRLSVSGNNNSGVFVIHLLAGGSAEATIDRITIRDGSSIDGAGIKNGGTLTLTNSTVSANTAAGGFGGGGIYNGGTMTLTNSTVSGNTSERVSGGGIYNGGGTLTLTNSTVSGNTAAGFGGGILKGGGTAKLANTIVAGNTSGSGGPDASGTFDSQGNNLIGKGDGSSGFSSPGDQVGTIASPLDPKLGPLRNNGGSTKTHALLQGSPATDAAANDRCLFTDQRGVARQDGDNNGSVICDIGAFERDAPTITNLKPAPGSSTSDATPLIAATVSDAQTNLAKTNIKLFVDGERKTAFDYGRSTDRLTYTSGQLSSGRHTVKIVATDGVNTTTRSWRFTVASG